MVTFAIFVTCGLLLSAQQPSEGKLRVTGRIIQSADPAYPVTFIIFTEMGGTTPFKKQVDADVSGRFDVELKRHAKYEFSLRKGANRWLEIGTFSFGDTAEFSFGNIPLESSANDQLAMPRSSVLHPTTSGSALVYGNQDVRVAAVYTTCPPKDDCRGSHAHILLTNGEEIIPPLEKDQVGTSQPLVSYDNRAAGWLVDFNNCCTSYPLSLPLVVYRPGKPLLRIFGDKRAIFDWHFLAEGKQLATCQEMPHGDPVPHYELHEVGSGRLLGTWDVAPTDDEKNDQAPKAPAPEAPAWVDSFVDNC